MRDVAKFAGFTFVMAIVARMVWKASAWFALTVVHARETAAPVGLGTPLTDPANLVVIGIVVVVALAVGAVALIGRRRPVARSSPDDTPTAPLVSFDG